MIYDKIKEYRLNYRKNKNELGSAFFTFIQGEMERVAKNPTDEQALKILKKIKTAVGEQPDTPAKYAEDSMISTLILEFEPKQLTEDEIRFHIQQTMNANVDPQPQTIGSVQKFFKDYFPGQYDGGTVTRIFKEGL